MDIKKIVTQEGYGFTKAQIKNVIAILIILKEQLSGNFASCGSGGGFYHMYFQLKNKRWIWFHAVTGDITISEPFDTAEQVYEAFWEEQEKVTHMIPKRHKSDGAGEFAQIKTVANDILKGDFVNVYQ